MGRVCGDGQRVRLRGEHVVVQRQRVGRVLQQEKIFQSLRQPEGLLFVVVALMVVDVCPVMVVVWEGVVCRVCACVCVCVCVCVCTTLSISVREGWRRK